MRDGLVRGLLAPVAVTAPKYLYDALGSRLFDAITELPEYHPTHTEAAIFSAHLPEMAVRWPAGATLVDLGAGNCEKRRSADRRGPGQACGGAGASL